MFHHFRVVKFSANYVGEINAQTSAVRSGLYFLFNNPLKTVKAKLLKNLVVKVLAQQLFT